MKLGSTEIGAKEVAGAALAFLVVAGVGKTLWDAKDHLGCPGDQSTTYGQFSAAMDKVAAGEGNSVIASKQCFSTLAHGDAYFKKVVKTGGAGESGRKVDPQNLEFVINDAASFGPTHARNKLESFLAEKGGLVNDEATGTQTDCGLTKDGTDIALVCNVRDKESALSASEFSKAAEGKFPAIAILRDLRKAPETIAPTAAPM